MKKTNSRQAELEQVGHEYFEDLIRPWLINSGRLETSLVAFSGSVAYGYSDTLSDIEIAVCLKEGWKAEELRDFRSLTSKNPQGALRHIFYKGVRMSVDDNTEWKLDLILENQMVEFWKETDPLVLFEITHAVPIWDPMDAVRLMRRRVTFYPKPVLVPMVMALWLKATDSGWYNALFAARRKNETSTNIFLYRGVEALLRTIFLLNRRFYPHTKWIPNELDKLGLTFHAKDYLRAMNNARTPIKKQEEFNKFMDEVRGYIRENRILLKKFIDNPWAMWSLIPNAEAKMQ